MLPRLLPLIVLVLCSPAQSHAQVPATTGPRFEVVSIKSSPPDAPPGRGGLQPDGRYILLNGPVRVLLDAAYPRQSREVINAPDWVTFERYDITAVAGRNTTREQLTTMLKELLRERFGLAAHLESRPQPVYYLVMARADRRPGPLLRPATVDCDKDVAQCSMDSRSGHIATKGWTMALLAGTLIRPAGRTVIDRTGLVGDFQLTLEYAGDPSVTDQPSLFAALQEQLGLTLEPGEEPLPVLVIDRIERPSPD
jgi:uncharacterized protein (TIGR03435 family)